MNEPESSLRGFTNLREAVAFIVRRLESGKVEELFFELKEAQTILARNAEFLSYFSKFIFTPLLEIHQKVDLRELYNGKDFPEDGTEYKLGGHMMELGCIHIDFVKRECDWALQNIWLCR